MREIQKAILSKSQALGEIPQSLELFYPNYYQINSVQAYLKQFFGVLKDSLHIYLEYPYVDRLYRNSYYTYFASKHFEYPKDSVRLAFFDTEISEQDFRLKEGIKKLQKAFLGFLVLRPTFPFVIGRSVISPKALQENNFQCCIVETEALINGVKLLVSGYPHCTQDRETITCAETTIWNVMEYFGNKYPQYSPVLPSKIIETLAGYSFERQLPSKGLPANHISYALKKFGFGVRIYSADAHGSENLRRIFNYYIDSGIPVIAALSNSLIGHAVVYIGYEHPPETLLNDYLSSSIPSFSLPKGELNVIEFADIEKRHIVMDDNYPPYQRAGFSMPTQYYEDERFEHCQVVSLIVPLDERIHLEALEARSLVRLILDNDKIGLVGVDEIVLRLFLTTSRSYKNGAAFNEKMDAYLQEFIINAAMPRYIWVAEISDKERLVNDECTGVILIDATSAIADFDAVIFIFYPEVAFAMTKGRPIKLDISAGIFERYTANLKGGF